MEQLSLYSLAAIKLTKNAEVYSGSHVPEKKVFFSVGLTVYLNLQSLNKTGNLDNNIKNLFKGFMILKESNNDVVIHGFYKSDKNAKVHFGTRVQENDFFLSANCRLLIFKKTKTRRCE